MSADTIAFICALALRLRWRLSQAGKAPDERTSYEKWLKGEENR